MLAEELTVLDVDSPLWSTARPLLEAALLLEQSDETFSWHGWDIRQIDQFLASLPPRSTLVVGVWDIFQEEEAAAGEPTERELLTTGIVCEVLQGVVQSIRTFNALLNAGLKPVAELEPGIEDAMEILRVVKTAIAPVAWSLFTDRATWNEWIFASGNENHAINKGELLASFARQGRCVLLGGQADHHRP
ncbi:MAG TPA: hypothetical protein VKR42_09500 [Ktedonobacteraceae bacterium]|nr:hypothetical protein [Ktedonobacteraceae bacterium]